MGMSFSETPKIKGHMVMSRLFYQEILDLCFVYIFERPLKTGLTVAYRDLHSHIGQKVTVWPLSVQKCETKKKFSNSICITKQSSYPIKLVL